LREPRREQNDGRLPRAARRRHGFQRAEQLVDVVLDRPDALLRHEIGEEPHHHLPVLQHVGDARGCAQVILEDVEVLVVDTDDIDARHLHIDVAVERQPVHLRPVIGIEIDEFRRDDAGAQDLARAIDVLQEQVECPHPLFEPAREMRPFRSGEDARDDVEGDQPLLGFRVAVDGEGDADPAEEELRLLPAMFQELWRRGCQPFLQHPVGLPALTVMAVHLVEDRARLHRVRRLPSGQAVPS